MKLKQIHAVDLMPTAPFSFDSTFHKPDHFTSGDNEWHPGIRWQTWLWQGKPYGLKFENTGTMEKPRLRVTVYGGSSSDRVTLATLLDEIRYRYNLDLDLTGFYQTFENDETLGPLIIRWRGMRPGHPSSLYEYLIIGVVLQNATVRRSIQMFRALLERYGVLIEYDGKKLWCLWSIGRLETVSEEELRALKVGYRAKSIKKIDEYFAQGRIDEMELRGKNRETQKKAPGRRKNKKLAGTCRRIQENQKKIRQHHRSIPKSAERKNRQRRIVRKRNSIHGFGSAAVVGWRGLEA